MIQRNHRKTRGFLILVAGLVLALALPEASFAKGKKPPPEPPPPEPGGCAGLDDAHDLDQDGIPDLMDCQGLVEQRNTVAFTYPGCATTPEAAPNCTDHTVIDIFAEIIKDIASTDISGYDDIGEIGTAIPDDEVFSFAELSLGINVHVMAPGSFLANRVVVVHAGGTQSGVTLEEDRSLGNLACLAQTTGTSFLGNPNEFGVFTVLTQRIFDKIDCIAGTAAQKREHLLNTSSHELGHTLRQAPDPTTFHQQTVGDCIMEASLEPDRRDRITIPTAFCSNTQATIAAGTTTQGPTVCGDVTTFDGDGVFDCLPAGP